MDECPTCGQTMPPKTGLPSGVALTKTEGKLFEIIRRAGKHGIASDTLCERLYADNPDGGPVTARHVVYVLVNKVNGKIRDHGVAIRSQTHGPWPCNYWLSKIALLLLLAFLPLATPANALACFKTGEIISRTNKICLYDCLGSTRAININFTRICPISIQSGPEPNSTLEDENDDE